MRINDFYNITELVKNNVLNSEKEYLRLLKVIGNNQRYDFLSQLSIYDKNPSAIACASFDVCRERFNRTVMRGQRGISIINSTSTFKKVGYIFDISQTVSIDNNVNEVGLWSFDRGRYEKALKDMIEQQGYVASESVMRLTYLSENQEFSKYNMLIDLYKEKKLLNHLMDIQRQAIHFMREEKAKIMKAWKIESEEDQQYKTMMSALKEMTVKEIVKV